MLYVLFFSIKLPISFHPKVQQHWNQYFGHLFCNNLAIKFHFFLFLSFCDPAAKKEKRHDCFSWELCLVIIMLDGVLFTTIGRESGLKKKAQTCIIRNSYGRNHLESRPCWLSGWSTLFDNQLGYRVCPVGVID